jgi:hypothetical protein
VLRVLNADKKICKEIVIDLAKMTNNASGSRYRVHQVHSSGAFGIDIEAYRRKGLLIPPDL